MSLGNVFQCMLLLNGFKQHKTMQNLDNLGKINLQDNLDSLRVNLLNKIKLIRVYRCFR